VYLATVYAVLGLCRVPYIPEARGMLCLLSRAKNAHTRYRYLYAPGTRCIDSSKIRTSSVLRFTNININVFLFHKLSDFVIFSLVEIKEWGRINYSRIFYAFTCGRRFAFHPRIGLEATHRGFVIACLGPVE